MPLVICRECGTLRRAVARGQHPDPAIQERNPRAQAWYPVPHAAAGDDSGGRECPGVQVAH